MGTQLDIEGRLTDDPVLYLEHLAGFSHQKTISNGLLFKSTKCRTDEGRYVVVKVFLKRDGFSEPEDDFPLRHSDTVLSADARTPDSRRRRPGVSFPSLAGVDETDSDVSAFQRRKPRRRKGANGTGGGVSSTSLSTSSPIRHHHKKGSASLQIMTPSTASAHLSSSLSPTSSTGPAPSSASTSLLSSKSLSIPSSTATTITGTTSQPRLSLSSGRNVLLRCLSRLSASTHPNILPYSQVQETDKGLYLVRQYAYLSLKERIATRPFLNDEVQKRWVAMQVLAGLGQLHEGTTTRMSGGLLSVPGGPATEGLYSTMSFDGSFAAMSRAAHCMFHGDLNRSNVVVTGWDWVFLTDLAPFKPLTIEQNTQGSFRLFFDTEGRNLTTLAPERLGPRPVHVSRETFTEKMDVFSAGCVLAELFLDGRHLFEFHHLLTYAKSGSSERLDGHLKDISDPELREFIRSLLALRPEDRPAARLAALKFQMELCPPYFGILHRILGRIMMQAHSVERRVEVLIVLYDDIVDCIRTDGEQVSPMLHKFIATGKLVDAEMEQQQQQQKKKEEVVEEEKTGEGDDTETDSTETTPLKKKKQPTKYAVTDAVPPSPSELRSQYRRRRKKRHHTHGRFGRRSQHQHQQQHPSLVPSHLRRHHNRQQHQHQQQQKQKQKTPVVRPQKTRTEELMDLIRETKKVNGFVREGSDADAVVVVVAGEVKEEEGEEEEEEEGEKKKETTIDAFDLLVEQNEAFSDGFSRRVAAEGEVNQYVKPGDLQYRKYWEMEKKKPSYVQIPFRAAQGVDLLAPLLCTSIRACRNRPTTVRALQMMRKMSFHCTDNTRLQRLVPYVCTLMISSRPSLVKIVALKTLVVILGHVVSVPLSESNLFPDYILGHLLEKLKTDPCDLIRIALAETLADFARQGRRYLDLERLERQKASLVDAQAASASASATATATSPTSVSTSSSASSSPTGDIAVSDPLTHLLEEEEEGETSRRSPAAAKNAASIRCGFDEKLAMLTKHFVSLFEDLTKDRCEFVKIALLENIATFCAFCGRNKSGDFIVPVIIPFVNSASWRLRSAFFEHVPDMAVSIGVSRFSRLIVPCLHQPLYDHDETVVNAVLGSLIGLCEMRKLDRDRLINFAKRVAPLLHHPNVWIRYDAVEYFVQASYALGEIDTYCFLLPILGQHLTCPIGSVTQYSLLEGLKAPLNRAIFDRAHRRLKNYVPDQVSSIEHWTEVLGLSRLITEAQRDTLEAMKEYIYCSREKLHQKRRQTVEAIRLHRKQFQETNAPLKKLAEQDLMLADARFLPATSLPLRLSEASFPDEDGKKAVAPVGNLCAEAREHIAGVTSLDYFRKGRLLVSGSVDRSVRIWDVSSMGVTQTRFSLVSKMNYSLQKAAGHVLSVCSFPDSPIVALSSSRGWIQLLDFQASSITHTIAISHGESAVFRPYVDRVLSTGDYDSAVNVVRTFSLFNNVVVLAATQCGKVHALDRQAHTEIFQLATKNSLRQGPIVSFCGHDVWVVTGTRRGFISLWDLRFQMPIVTWRVGNSDHGTSINSMVLKDASCHARATSSSALDYSSIYVATSSPTIMEWDVKSEKIKSVFCCAEDPIENANRPSMLSQLRSDIKLFGNGDISSWPKGRPIPETPGLTSSSTTSVKVPGVGIQVRSVHENDDRDVTALRELCHVDWDTVKATPEVSDLYVHPGDGTLVSAGTDRRIRLWRTREPSKSSVLSGLHPSEEASYRVFEGAETEFVPVVREYIGDSTQQRTQGTYGLALNTIHSNSVSAVSVVHNERGVPRIASADMSGVIKFWD